MKPKTFVSYLAKLRKLKGISQNEMAEHLNISRPTYSDWEKYPMKMPLGVFIKINQYFGCGYDDMLNKLSNVNLVDIGNESVGIEAIMNKLNHLEVLLTEKEN